METSDNRSAVKTQHIRNNDFHFFISPNYSKDYRGTCSRRYVCAAAAEIDHIDVYETEGKGKNRTQRLAIYYRFTGYIELPDSAPRAYELERHCKANTQQGVEIEYIPEPA